MINLLGCNKDDFLQLLNIMHYKPKKVKDNGEDFYVYKPKYIKNNVEKNDKKLNKGNPFDKLSEVRFS